MKNFFSLLILTFLSISASHAEMTSTLLETFHSDAAKQGVAVDEKSIFVISNHSIAKYNKQSFELLNKWECEEGNPLIHLNAGSIHDGKLYCAHSNYSDSPMASSVEIWDTETLEHIGSISLGIGFGSMTWAVKKDNQWWVGFAHYTGRGSEPGKDNTWTHILVFDENWRRIRGYTLPQEVIDRFGTRSNSGGDWGPDGSLYLSGHDRKELYRMELPNGGSVLQLKEIVAVEFEGQAFCWDRYNPGHLYGIIKSDRMVIKQTLLAK